VLVRPQPLQLLVENIEVDTGHWAFLCLGQGRR
jgi:hypothetical protein